MWSGEHRAFIVEEFIRNGGSPVATQCAFRIRFALGQRETVPDKKMIYCWVSNFRQTGSALKQTPPGWPRTATRTENVAVVRASIQKSPWRSARKYAAALRLSYRNVRRILHRDRRTHPYKIATAQKLKGSDFENRTKLCRDLLNVRVTDVVFFSDEAHFHLSGTVNKQNFRYWSESNPRELHQRAGYDPKVTVWCAVFNYGVLGPYFLEEDDVTVTVNSDHYCECYRIFSSLDWAKFSMINMVLIMCGFSTMAQQPIHLVVPFHFSEKCFLDMLSPCVVISGGRRLHQIWPPTIFSLGLPQSKGLRKSPNFGSSEESDTTGSCCHYTWNDSQGHGQLARGATSVYQYSRLPLEWCFVQNT